MRQIETAIEIAAPPAKVWQALTDFRGYADWNPFIVAAEGTATVGTELKATIKPTGRKAMSFCPTVLVAEPSRELRWRGKLFVSGIFDGEHYFRLEAAGAGCRFTHGERFSGLLVGLMGSGFFDSVRRGFEAMNKALKARVEK